MVTKWAPIKPWCVPPAEIVDSGACTSWPQRWASDVPRSGANVGATTEKCPPFTWAQIVRSGASAGMVRWLLAFACSLRYGARTGWATHESAFDVIVCAGEWTEREGDWPMRPPTPTMNGLPL